MPPAIVSDIAEYWARSAVAGTTVAGPASALMEARRNDEIPKSTIAFKA
jgi:hypothetical protein